MQDRTDEAREAYSSALMLASRGQGQVNMVMLQQKLQSLSQQAPRELDAPLEPASPVAAETSADITDGGEE